jgi:hypothetical protein
VTRVVKPKAPPYLKKTHEVQFSINQILNDEIEKKNLNYTKGLKKLIKRIMIKIKI